MHFKLLFIVNRPFSNKQGTWSANFNKLLLDFFIISLLCFQFSQYWNFFEIFYKKKKFQIFWNLNQRAVSGNYSFQVVVVVVLYFFLFFEFVNPILLSKNFKTYIYFSTINCKYSNKQTNNTKYLHSDKATKLWNQLNCQVTYCIMLYTL